MTVINNIKKLKEKKNAVILAHNYQPIDILKVADYIGDSLELCIKAKETDADIIVFCGVDFMAETAKILNEDKKVLIPEIKDTQCPMAHQIPPKLIEEYKKRYPNSKVVIYVNTTGESKAQADSTCTSANADKVVNSFKEDNIIFGPDQNLAYYVKKRSDKNIIGIPEDGHCYVHKKFTLNDVEEKRKKYPNAKLIVHPECDPQLQDIADYVLSTGGMLKKVLHSEYDEFIIGTEVGMIDRIKLEMEKQKITKKLIPLNENAICEPMKQITLEKLEKCLIEEKYEVILDKEIINKSKKAIEYMLKLE